MERVARGMSPLDEAVAVVLALLRGGWRRRWVAVAVAWMVCIVGWTIVYRLPDLYSSQVRFYADTSTILKPLLRGLAIQSDVKRDLQLINQSLLSRPNLERLARMTDLDVNATTPEEAEALYERLRGSIRIAAGRKTGVYTISYEHTSPEVAKRVVQSLMNIFVEDSLGQSRRDSSSAQDFLDRQINEYEARLVEAENQLKEFKQRNVGLMPSDGGDYYQRLQAALTALQEAKLQLAEAENRRDELQRQLDDAEEPLLGMADSAVLIEPTSQYDGRIASLRQNLDELLLNYTEQHPDVVRTRETILKLEERRAAELSASEPVYAREESSLNPVETQLKIVLTEAEAQVASLRVRVDDYSSRVARLQTLVDTIPEKEAALKRLNRDYSINKRNFEELLSRRETARLSEEAQQTSENVKFRIIDPPFVPPEPSGPNRPLFYVAVLVTGIAAGIGLALLLAFARPAFYSGRELRSLAGIPILGSVSFVTTARDRRRALFATLAFVAISGLLLAAFGAVITLDAVGLEAVVKLLAQGGITA